MKNTRIKTFMRGIQGSGKSTFIKARLMKNSNAVVISRDDVRKSLWGDTYYSSDISSKEKIVAKIINNNIKIALLSKKDVLLDEMNISPQYLKATISWLKHLSEVGHFHIQYEIIDFMHVSLDDCIKNNENRKGTWGYVPPDVIKKTYKKAISSNSQWYEEFAKLTSEKNPSEIKQNLNNDKAVIFDLDGTLALMGDRDPFDTSIVHLDELNIPVYNLYKAIKNAGSHKIIIATGREGSEEGQTNTKKWLDKHGITYDEIHFRPEGLYKKDSIIKKTIWEDLVNRYYIDFMVDDRTQVVEEARMCGFTVLQVSFGDF